jgi:hypothetical protein
MLGSGQNAQVSFYFFAEKILYFDMAGNGSQRAGPPIDVNIVSPAVAFKHAPRGMKLFEQLMPLQTSTPISFERVSQGGENRLSSRMS